MTNKAKYQTLSAKERVFLSFYAANGYSNAVDAARKAGYAESTALKQSSMWVHRDRESSTKPHLWDELQKDISKRADKCGLTADLVLGKLMDIIQMDPGDFLMWDAEGDMTFTPSDELTPKQRALVVEAGAVKVKGGSSLKIKLMDRMPAIVKAMEHLKLIGRNSDDARDASSDLVEELAKAFRKVAEGGSNEFEFRERPRSDYNTN